MPRTKQTLKKVFEKIDLYKNKERRHSFQKSRVGINIVSTSKAKRNNSVNDRRSLNKINSRLLEGISL